MARPWIVCLALVAGCSSGSEAKVFIALDGDFAPFLTWQSVDVPAANLGAGHPDGPSVAYLSARAPAGAKVYPVGTMIVKAFESDPEQTDWDIYAMAKRGGGFNPKGAVDWEFFRLRIAAGGMPLIVGRGTFAIDPFDDGGVGYGILTNAVDGLCNGCHGTPQSAATDHVLLDAFDP